MKVGDKVIHKDFPLSIATITKFEMSVKDGKNLKKKEIRTKYHAKFDDTGLEFVFYGFDIGRKIEAVNSEKNHQISLFEWCGEAFSS